MSTRHFVHVIRLLAMMLFLSAPNARAELAAWDQAKVSALAKDLARATDAVHETFIQEPPPNLGSMQNESYYRLKHCVWMLRGEAHVLVKSLEEGEGREQTMWIYEILMSLARSVRYEAPYVFVAKAVGEQAAAVRGVLNQLGPYYDPDFQALPPHPHIESDATR
jgi:hypothetical protein